MTKWSHIIGDIDTSDDAGREDAVFKAWPTPVGGACSTPCSPTTARRSGALCAALPTMTRFGVMKHLGVLEHAGLVVTHRAGRTKLHYLNPVPIREIHDRWITKYAQPVAAAMAGLRAELEAGTA